MRRLVGLRRADDRRRPAKVPTHHDVGERVVVDELVILVGADDTVHMTNADFVDPDPARPVARSFDDQLTDVVSDARGISRPFEVVQRRPRHVSVDVLLSCAGEDLDDVALVVARRPGRDVIPAVGRLPRESGTGAPDGLRAGTGATEPHRPILDHRPC